MTVADSRGGRSNTVGRRLLGVAVAYTIVLPCCTTFMQPVVCGDKTHACGERQNVRFCENVVTALEGPDCASAGLRVGKPFCYVSARRCVQTTYALKGRDCVVVRYEPVRDWYECSPGTPTFDP